VPRGVRHLANTKLSASLPEDSLEKLNKRTFSLIFKKQVCHFLIFSLVHIPAIVLLIIALSTQTKLTGSGRFVKLLQAPAQIHPAPVSHLPQENGCLISAKGASY
jgi:hypothetical protein